jgi:hypothetical protein
MMKKENLIPPDPSDMMEEISATTTDGADRICTINGLRMSEDDSYMEFCENFMPCICTDEEWKRNSKIRGQVYSNIPGGIWYSDLHQRI